jgi:hypothetical protein
MDTIQATSRNKLFGSLADALLSAKTKGNEYEVKDWVPLIGGTSLGDMFFGNAPELTDDVSYNGLKALFTGGNSATGGLGTYGLDPRTFDAAMLGADVAGLGKGIALTGKAATKKAVSGATNLSKRNFLKGAAALGAAGTLGMLKHTSDNLAKPAVKNVAKDNEYIFHTFNNLDEYNNYLNNAVNSSAKDDLFFSEERLYKEIKSLKKKIDRPDLKIVSEEYANNHFLQPNQITQRQLDYYDEMSGVLNNFSPKAKEEMKAFKEALREYYDDFHAGPGELLDSYLAKPPIK